MSQLPACPKCQSPYTYEDGFMYICPECSYEWQDGAQTVDNNHVLDAYGQELVEGDSIIVLKDLKVKGSSSIVKQGTKVKNIRIVDGDHNIDCKIDGIGAMSLKSEFVKKA